MYNNKLFRYSLIILIYSNTLYADTTIDSIAGVVAGEPILKSDLSLKTKKSQSDSNVEQVLDDIIFQKLIKLEAQKRRIAVSESELDFYIKEVAKRNNLNTEQFKQALQKDGMDFNTYKSQIELEILKTKLAGQIFKDGIAISDEEIEKHTASNEVTESEHQKQVKLRQIFLSNKTYDQQNLKKTIKKIQSELKKGEDFAELAKKYSESPDAENGGELDLINENDLNPDIFDAIFSLDESESSKPVYTENGVHIFQVTERISSEQEIIENQKEDITKQLKAQKIQVRLEEFFTQEIFKKYSIERKI